MTETIDPRTSGAERPEKRRRWLVPAIWLAMPLLMVGGIIAMTESRAGPAPSRPSNAIATGEISEGRHVAVVVYETDTFPHLDLFRIGSIGFSVQVQAFDLDSGEPLWDTMLSNEHPSVGAEALAVGGDHAYVRTDDGLVILDTASGAITARDDSIPGLGDEYVASRNTYGWDLEAKQVVLLDRQGEIRSVPLGADTATSATQEVSKRWQGQLAAAPAEPVSYYQSTSNATRDKAQLPGPEPKPDPLTGIVPDDNMLWASWAPEDAVTSTIVLDQPTRYAAGARFGFAVSESHHGAGYTIQVADLDTRTARARLDIASGSGIQTVAVDPHGYVVLVMPNADQQGQLIVVTADSLHASTIGERGWLGS